MSRRARATLLPLLVVLSMLLSGCHVLEGDDAADEADDQPQDDGQDPTTGTNNTTEDGGTDGGTMGGTEDGGTDEAPIPTLTIDTYNASVAAGDPIEITWSVAFDDADRTDSTPHTALHWADFSVADPEAPADYGNTSALHEDVEIPAGFSGDFSVDFNGDLYLRAHLIYGGKHYWSDEVTIEVSPAATGGTVHTVSISTLAVCSEAPYDPDPVEIKTGDSVQWANANGTLDCAHTATSDTDSDFAFDTGTIDKGATSDPIVFPEAGTFPYHCSIHPGMTASVEVTA